MKLLLWLLSVLLPATSTLAEKTLYDFTVKGAKGEDVPLSNFKSKPVVLIVNVAR